VSATARSAATVWDDTATGGRPGQTRPADEFAREKRLDPAGAVPHGPLGAVRLDNHGVELRTRLRPGASAVIRLRRAHPGR
jgi:hypothetical protein